MKYKQFLQQTVAFDCISNMVRWCNWIVSIGISYFYEKYWLIYRNKM
uniref:Uncharacterized protein n=1 Tax=Anguilla anguilla TaxID=7936 RepID=A0A0E9SM19_ANGAN